MDINPLMITPQGCFAADVMLRETKSQVSSRQGSGNCLAAARQGTNSDILSAGNQLLTASRSGAMSAIACSLFLSAGLA